MSIWRNSPLIMEILQSTWNNTMPPFPIIGVFRKPLPGLCLDQRRILTVISIADKDKVDSDREPGQRQLFVVQLLVA